MSKFPEMLNKLSNLYAKHCPYFLMLDYTLILFCLSIIVLELLRARADFVKPDFISLSNKVIYKQVEFIITTLNVIVGRIMGTTSISTH